MKITAQWLAGFIDGEGCLHVHAGHRGFSRLRLKGRLTITNTHLPTLQAIAARWGGKVYARIHKPYYEGRNVRQSWNLNWDDQDQLLNVLKAIQPFMVTKKDQVDFFLTEYAPTMRGRKGAYHLSKQEHDKRLEVYEALKEMKKEEFQADPAGSTYQKAPEQVQ